MAVDRDRFKRRSEEEKPDKKVNLLPDNKIPGEILTSPFMSDENQDTTSEKDLLAEEAKSNDSTEGPITEEVTPEPVAIETYSNADGKLKTNHGSRLERLVDKTKGIKKSRLTVIAPVCLVILAIILISIFGLINKKPKAVASHAKTKEQSYVYNPIEAGTVKIPFSPAVPSDEPQLAKLVGTNYNAPDHSYTFSDLYLGVPIQVSEQELPGKFPSTAAALATVSKALPANTSFASPYGEIYMNNAASPAKQTLVASRFGLLIFIQSSYILDNSDWSSYIGGLEEVN